MAQVILIPYSSNLHKKFVSSLLSNKLLMDGWGMDPLTKQEIDEWLRDETRLSLIVCDLKSKVLVGYVDFYDLDPKNKQSDWGVVIDPKYKGLGYAQEAIKESLKYGFGELKLEKIKIYIEGNNDVSRHIHEKIGFRFIKIDEKKRRIYSLTKPESRKLKIIL